MSMKDFLKEWKPKELEKMDKDDRTALLYDYLPDIVSFYIKKSHSNQDDLKQLFDRMEEERFAKTLRRILKTPDHSPVDLPMATVIYDFMERRHQQLSEELVAMYSDIIDKILEKRIKKLSKKLEISKDLLKELLVVVAEPEAISSEKFIGLYVHRVLRKLYTMAKETDLGIENVKTLKKIFKQLFGKEMLSQVAINALLERKDYIKNYNENQQAIWNLVTNFALETLEELEKEEIRELMQHYVERRAKDAQHQRDSARRIQFSSVPEEDYPKIHKAYKKLSDKEEKCSRFL